MRLAILSRTLGGHTHLALRYTSRDGSHRTATLSPLRNEDAGDFLEHLAPDEVTDETPVGHEPVAARWAEARRVRAERITLDGYRCERCTHQWVPRVKGEEPRVCPSCKSPYWNTARTRKGGPCAAKRKPR